MTDVDELREEIDFQRRTNDRTGYVEPDAAIRARVLRRFTGSQGSLSAIRLAAAIVDPCIEHVLVGDEDGTGRVVRVLVKLHDRLAAYDVSSTMIACTHAAQDACPLGTRVRVVRWR